MSTSDAAEDDRVAGTLRTFIYGELRKGRQPWAAGSLASTLALVPEPNVARTMAPLSLEERLLVLDYSALIALAFCEKSAILEARSMVSLEDDQSDLSNVVALQSALRHTTAIALFASRPDIAMEQLSATEVTWLPYPAASYVRTRRSQRGVALIIHDQSMFDAAEQVHRLQQRFPDLPLHSIPSHGPESVSMDDKTLEDALASHVHVHLGATDDALPGLRIVDSLAARRCVIHARSATGDVPVGDVAISHMHSGLSAQTAPQIAEALQRVLRDAATVDVFARNGSALAEEFNRVIETQLQAVLQ